MADFPVAWWQGLPTENPNFEDKRGYFWPEQANQFYDPLGFPVTPKPGQSENHMILLSLLNAPGDQLQNSLGYDDLLKYRPGGVAPVVMSLREANKKLPKKSSGGK